MLWKRRTGRSKFKSESYLNQKDEALAEFEDQNPNETRVFQFHSIAPHGLPKGRTKKDPGKYTYDYTQGQIYHNILQQRLPPNKVNFTYEDDVNLQLMPKTTVRKTRELMHDDRRVESDDELGPAGYFPSESSSSEDVSGGDIISKEVEKAEIVEEKVEGPQEAKGKPPCKKKKPVCPRRCICLNCHPYHYVPCAQPKNQERGEEPEGQGKCPITHKPPQKKCKHHSHAKPPKEPTKVGKDELSEDPCPPISVLYNACEQMWPLSMRCYDPCVPNNKENQQPLKKCQDLNEKRDQNEPEKKVQKKGHKRHEREHEEDKRDAQKLKQKSKGDQKQSKDNPGAMDDRKTSKDKPGGEKVKVRENEKPKPRDDKQKSTRTKEKGTGDYVNKRNSKGSQETTKKKHPLGGGKSASNEKLLGGQEVEKLDSKKKRSRVNDGKSKAKSKSSPARKDPEERTRTGRNLEEKSGRRDKSRLDKRQNSELDDRRGASKNNRSKRRRDYDYSYSDSSNTYGYYEDPYYSYYYGDRDYRSREEERRVEGPRQIQAVDVCNDSPFQMRPKNLGLIPAQTNCFPAPLANVCSAMKENEGDNKGVDLNFGPIDDNGGLDIEVTVEPKPKQHWRTLMDMGFSPVVCCQVPPVCINRQMCCNNNNMQNPNGSKNSGSYYSKYSSKNRSSSYTYE